MKNEANCTFKNGISDTIVFNFVYVL